MCLIPYALTPGANRSYFVRCYHFLVFFCLTERKNSFSYLFIMILSVLLIVLYLPVSQSPKILKIPWQKMASSSYFKLMVKSGCW